MLESMQEKKIIKAKAKLDSIESLSRVLFEREK